MNVFSNPRPCDGSGWFVYRACGEDHHDVCPGCSNCPENADLMDRLEAAEGELISMVCGEEFDPEAVALLMATAGGGA